MYFKQFLDEQCGCASYLVASRKTREAAIVDPSIQIGQYGEILEARGFTLRTVIDTHIHADHLSGARLLRDTYGAELCLHASAEVSYSFRGLQDGEVIPVGQLKLQVLHTPGHRKEMISIAISNPPRSAEPSMVLTGDSLLVGDVGRPDFGSGDAAAQYRSIMHIFEMPDWVAVFPGHFEGPCGKAMCGRPSTTVGFERLYNPISRLDRDAFLTRLAEGIPARPLNMIAIEATNRGTAEMNWAMLTTSPEVPLITVEQLSGKLDGMFLCDVREPSEFAAGHVPQAQNVPGAELATSLERIPADTPIAVICERGSRAKRAAQFLVQQGYGNVLIVEGGTAAWRDQGLPIREGDVESPAVRYIESEWTHAGALGPDA